MCVNYNTGMHVPMLRHVNTQTYGHLDFVIAVKLLITEAQR